MPLDRLRMTIGALKEGIKNPDDAYACRDRLWAHLGSNQGPLDYESSALTSWAKEEWGVKTLNNV